MHRPYDDWIVTPLRRLLGFRPAVRVSPPVMVAGLALVVIAAIYARSLDNYFQSDDFDWLYAYGLHAAETGTVQALCLHRRTRPLSIRRIRSLGITVRLPPSSSTCCSACSG